MPKIRVAGLVVIVTLAYAGLLYVLPDRLRKWLLIACGWFSSLVAIIVWRLCHPKRTRITTLKKLTKESGVIFPDQTVVLDGMYVNERGSIYPIEWCFGVVTMRRSKVAEFFENQAESSRFKMVDQSEMEQAKRDIVYVPKSLRFKCEEWQVDHVKLFQAANFNGSGIAFVDCDNPEFARVYIANGYHAEG